MKCSAALSTAAVGACDEPTGAVGKAVQAAPRWVWRGLLRAAQVSVAVADVLGHGGIELFLMDHGHGFDYDIEAAKPTVTLQAWRRLLQTFRPERAKSPECQLSTWTALVLDRTVLRAAMAAEVGISTDHAKFVCQSILNGGWASPHLKNRIRQLIGYQATVRLMESEIYKRLRTDFQVFYTELKEINAISNLGIIKAGQTPGMAISALYNRIEDEVMTAVDKFLAGREDAWFIHDGFITKNRISRPDLEQYIKDETGYLIRLDETELCK